MSYIDRSTDVALGNADLEDLYTFRKFPVFMGCVEHDPSEDILEDMHWKISKGSGMIQLNLLLPLDVIYKSEHGSGTIGKIWDEHHASFANFIYKFKPGNILEIGGLHGALAGKYLKLDNDAKWTMIEPNPIVDPNLHIRVIRGFFDAEFTSEEKFDAIVHSHVLEHVYNPDEFINHKSSFMRDGDLLIFSIPNMEAMLKNNYNNCINFEHTMYLTEPYVEYFLNKYGFELIEKQYFKSDHSIFYCTKKNQNIPTSILRGGLYEKNKSAFQKYINYHLDTVNIINSVINETILPVYLFGAHIFSQYLISFGLNSSKIICLLDNDSKKENKRLYGTSLISKNPRILKNIPEAIVILRAGIYNDEIKKDILENINPNVIFI